ncbi:hypothetical protein ANCCAN_25057 [Ancylostoma caninum]|uniref:Spore coat protein T domain protein n=1 Tax=Ancylostoma caninum TaxID=29170 RepID=A0A368FDV8_ANCCA|nr:hypothetical protein ANCCAN_25057 [Ancylostoma caninum]
MQCPILLALLSLFAITTFTNDVEAIYIPPPYEYGYGYGPGPIPPPIPPPVDGYGYGYGYPCKKREAGFEEQPKETEDVVLPKLNE